MSVVGLYTRGPTYRVNVPASIENHERIADRVEGGNACVNKVGLWTAAHLTGQRTNAEPVDQSFFFGEMRGSPDILIQGKGAVVDA